MIDLLIDSLLRTPSFSKTRSSFFVNYFKSVTFKPVAAKADTPGDRLKNELENNKRIY
jgi:hypothetical protein